MDIVEQKIKEAAEVMEKILSNYKFPKVVELGILTDLLDHIAHSNRHKG